MNQVNLVRVAQESRPPVFVRKAKVKHKNILDVSVCVCVCLCVCVFYILTCVITVRRTFFGRQKVTDLGLDNEEFVIKS